MAQQNRVKNPFGFEAQKPNHRSSPFNNNIENKTQPFNTNIKIKLQNPAQNQSIQLNNNNNQQDYQQEVKTIKKSPFEVETLLQTKNVHVKKNPFDEDPLNGIINLNEKEQNENINYDEEPPLLEDLGINLEEMKQKSLSVLFFKKQDKNYQNEGDLCGPILIAILLGAILLLNGKIHFGYIYGFSVIGTLGIYCIMNFLSQEKNIEVYNTMSILGYCLIPLCFLATFAIFIDLKQFFYSRGIIGMFLCAFTIIWSTFCSTQLFDQSLGLDDRKWLVAYPACLFYLTFVLITVF